MNTFGKWSVGLACASMQTVLCAVSNEEQCSVCREQAY